MGFGDDDELDDGSALTREIRGDAGVVAGMTLVDVGNAEENPVDDGRGSVGRDGRGGRSGRLSERERGEEGKTRERSTEGGKNVGG